MRLSVAAVVVVVCAMARPAAAAEQGATAPAELSERLRELEAAFNAHDPKQVAALVAEDATFVNPLGERAEGREQIAALLRSNLETVLKGTQHRFSIEHARMVTPDLAFLDLRQEISGGQPPPGAPRPWVAHGVMLARKDGAKWSILEFRPYFFIPKPGAAGRSNMPHGKGAGKPAGSGER
jgi:uncharacterized protein (TIGR02246 family)